MVDIRKITIPLAHTSPDNGLICPFVQEVNCSNFQDDYGRIFTAQYYDEALTKPVTPFCNLSGYANVYKDSNYIQIPLSDNKKDKLLPCLLKDHILKYRIIVTCRNKFFIYNGFVYQEITDFELKMLIAQYCEDYLRTQSSASIVDNVISFLKIDSRIAIESFDDYQTLKNIIVLDNGIFDINTGFLYPPDPQLLCTQSLNLSYFPYNYYAPYFDNFLYVLTGGNCVLMNRVLEMIGYIISSDNDGKCFFVFAGIGDSGKSVLLSLIESFFYEKDVNSTSINALGDRFTVGYLSGKRLCVFGDTSNETINSKSVSTLKCITGNDTLTSEKKYCAQERFINRAKIVLSTNHPIIPENNDEAFLNRMRIMPFVHSVPKSEQDPNLRGHLYNERDAIFLRAMLAYKNLKANNYVFSGEFEANMIYNNYFNLINSENTLTIFVNECCIFDATAKVYTNDLYNSYQEYSVKMGVQAIYGSVEVFSRALKSHYPQLENSRWREHGNEGKSGFVGIKLACSV